MSPIRQGLDPIVVDDRSVGGQEITSTPPDPIDKASQWNVNVTVPDYAKLHQDAIDRGDVAPDTPAPNVKVHRNIDLQCPSCRVDFKATFAEVQRILKCPDSCGGEIFIPEQYRGMP